MGPVIALFFALAAVQAVPINNINEIDIFCPTQNYDFSLDKLGHVYSNYYRWSNPIFGYNQRYFLPGFSPLSPEYRMQQHMPNYIYNQYNQYFKRNQLSIQDLFESPVIVVTPSAQEENSFAAFFLHSGLRSLFRYKSFSWLQQYLMSPNLKGLVFYPHNMYNIRFFEMPVSSITVPEHFRMSEFLDSVDYPESIPIIFIAPEEIFAEMHFDNIAKVTDFRVYKDVIEVVPSYYPLPQSQLQQIFSHQHSNKIQPVQPNLIHHHSQDSQTSSQPIKPPSASRVDFNDASLANLLTVPYTMLDGNTYGYRAQDMYRFLQPQHQLGIYGYGDYSNQGITLANRGMAQNNWGKVVGWQTDSLVNNQMETTPAISTNHQTIMNTDTSRLLTNPVPVVSKEKHSEVLSTISSGHQNIDTVAPVHSDVEKSDLIETTITKTVSSSSTHPQLTAEVETHTSTVEKTLSGSQVENVIVPGAEQQKVTHYETVVYPGKSVAAHPSTVEEMSVATTDLHSGAQSQDQHSSLLGSLVKSTGQGLVSRISNLPIVSSLGNLQGSVDLNAGAHVGSSSQSSIVAHESSTVSKSGGSLLGGSLLGGLSGGVSLSGSAGLNAGAAAGQQLGTVTRTTITKETHSSSGIPSGGLNFSFGIGADAHGKSLLKTEKENLELLKGK